MKHHKILIFLVHALIGLYFINFQFNFVEVPDYIKSFEPWIIFAGGILVLLGGINYLRASKPKVRYPQ